MQYFFSLLLFLIIFIIIVSISILLTVSTDNLNRASVSIGIDLLDVAISNETFSVLINIFLIGFVLAILILLYYIGGYVENVSKYRILIVLYSLIGLTMIGLLMMIALDWSAKTDINSYLDTNEDEIDTTKLSDINTALNYTNISIIISIVALVLTLCGLISTFV